MCFTAALGMAGRQGVGGVRHLAVATLWLQGLVANKAVELANISGQMNPADLGTNAVTREVLHKLAPLAGIFDLTEAKEELMKDAARGGVGAVLARSSGGERVESAPGWLITLARALLAGAPPSSD